ncbi:MAG TPA: AAA family ATPase [Thermoanaerobaculia bacterium]|nr:AAA family ATPase [Thermoanaerobaculia bacterium]
MEGKRFLRSIELKNILSYGPEGVTLELEPLNVLIGPNASGKSNLIQALRILPAALNDFAKPIREGGGIDEWLWKGAGGSGIARLGVKILDPTSGTEVGYDLGFTADQSRFSVTHEEIHGRAGRIYYFDPAYPSLERIGPASRGFLGADFEGFEVRRDLSILAQLRSPKQDYEFSVLARWLPRLTFFQRPWIDEGLRRSQAADLPGDFLLENGYNLGPVLTGLMNRAGLRHVLMDRMKRLYPQVEDVVVTVHGGGVQIFLHETGLSSSTPTSRISDGTLRYLCLLAILLHPEPPPLICIEEPELGLHPDAMSVVGEMLIDASTRTQLIVTTHSPSLISALSSVPEAVVVCERGNAGTTLTRLEPAKLEHWLDEYTLGDVWQIGALGGNR